MRTSFRVCRSKRRSECVTLRSDAQSLVYDVICAVWSDDRSVDGWSAGSRARGEWTTYIWACNPLGFFGILSDAIAVYNQYGFL
ncbi:Uncharacterized protein DAT39_019614 [Clarias magur]|uniref:Uncharacterized protein n=1 Tax=Clarias magur TaxID=1594786 RepID=A0A8J4WTT2_CLAMG|nr:Uncharacterized protein DAT39_019614 [Clarias magur]